MRSISLIKADKTRPAVILTREPTRFAMRRVTVAPITSTIKGLSTEVRVGRANGLDHDCVISCDNIHTVDAASIGREIGFLLPAQEQELAQAIIAAFDLETK